MSMYLYVRVVLSTVVDKCRGATISPAVLSSLPRCFAVLVSRRRKGLLSRCSTAQYRACISFVKLEIGKRVDPPGDPPIRKSSPTKSSDH